MAPIRKAVVNFVLEGATLITLILLAATGFIMEWRLPPGSGGMGPGRGAGREGALTMLGMNRHQWGDIHFWIAMTFLILLTLHLFLHWWWIWGLARGRDPHTQGKRGLIFLGVTLLLFLGLLVPWLLPVRRAPTIGPDREEFTESLAPRGADSGLRGSMTLCEAATAAGVSLEEASRRLGLDPALHADQRLGPLLRTRGMTMAEARRRLGEPLTEKSQPVR